MFNDTIGAHLFRQTTFMSIARNANNRFGTKRLCHLNLQQPGNAKAQHYDNFIGLYIGAILSVEDRRHHLDKRPLGHINVVSEGKHIARRGEIILSINAVNFTAQHPSIFTKMGITSGAIKAVPTIEHRINDHAITWATAIGGLAFDNFSHPFMTHNDGIIC